jgi:predicted permease
MALIAFGVSALAGVLFGSLPALRAMARDTAESIRQTGSSGLGGRQRAGRALVLVQIAVSVPLLVGAMLFLRTLHNLAGVDLGFQARGLMMFRLDPSVNGYDRVRIHELYQRVLDRLDRVPGVRETTLVENALISGWVSNTGVSVDGAPSKSILINRVGPGFFDTLGLEIVAGRGLGLQDRDGGPRVGVVNEAAMRQLFDGRNPIGRTFTFDAPQWFGDSAEIIGVVRDSKYDSLKRDAQPTVFLSYSQSPVAGPMFVVVRASALAGLPERLRAAVAEVDRDVAIAEIKTQDQQINETIARERAFSLLLVGFGSFALMLACIGLYGLTSYSVARRTSEIGIRMALGAGRMNVLWLVMRQVVWLSVGGLILGVPLAAAASRSVRAMLFGVQPADVVSIVAGCTILFAVSLAAGLIPATRAARLDPLVALRRE